MEKNVVINIVDTHEYDGEKTTSELMTVGVFAETSDGYILTYEEQDETLKECMTTLNISEPGRVVMTRTGEYNTELVLERSKRNSCHYSTPMGDLFIGVYAKKVEPRFTSAGGELKLSYTLDFNTGFLSNNELSISVREAQ